jgi:hypothetical protein
MSRHLVLSLDGTRDRADLLRDLSDLIKSGTITVSQDGKSRADNDTAIGHLTDGIDRSLSKLAQLAVLVA